MSFKKYVDGAWQDADGVKKFAGGQWQDAQFVRRWDGANWVECWISNRFIPGSSELLGPDGSVTQTGGYTRLYLKSSGAVPDAGYYQAELVTRREMSLSSAAALAVSWEKEQTNTLSDAQTAIVAQTAGGNVELFNAKAAFARTTTSVSLPAGTTRVLIQQRLNPYSGTSGATVALKIYQITLGGQVIPVEP